MNFQKAVTWLRIGRKNMPGTSHEIISSIGYLAAFLLAIAIHLNNLKITGNNKLNLLREKEKRRMYGCY